jgi:hypothetical protein
MQRLPTVILILKKGGEGNVLWNRTIRMVCLTLRRLSDDTMAPILPYPYFDSPWFFTKEDERAYQVGQVNILKNQLAQIKKRLEELKIKKKEIK